MKLENLIPMLNVADIEHSLDFYSRALAFEVVSDPAAVAEWRWATIRSGRCELMLSETGHPPPPPGRADPHADDSWPAIYYFYPDDVEALHAATRERGFEPTALMTTHYGMREFSLRDPDGHWLSFGQDAEGPD